MNRKSYLLRAAAWMLALMLLCSCLPLIAMAEAAEEPVTIKMYRPWFRYDPQTDAVLLELQKRLNIKLEMITAEGDQSWNKLNLMMATGDELDVMQADNWGANPWPQWAKEGLLHDLDTIMRPEDHRYIDTITNYDTFAPLKVDGKRFVIPGAHQGFDFGFFVRKDWLDKVGMDLPTDEASFYAMLKAFKDNNLGANGVTVPWAVANNVDFRPIASAFGAVGDTKGYPSFRIEDGKVVALETDPRHKAYLTFMNKLYREGLINSDYPVIDFAENLNKYVYSGQAGCLFYPSMELVDQNTKALDPDAEWVSLEPFSAQGYQYEPFNELVWWMVLGVPKTSKNPERALDFIEYCVSEEGRKLLSCGIEGRHWTDMQPDGTYTMNVENWSKDYDLGATGYDCPIWNGFCNNVHGYLPVIEHDTYEDALANVTIYVSDKLAGNQFNWRSMVKDYGAKWKPAQNPLYLVKIDEVEEARLNIVSNVDAVYISKMIIAKSEEECNQLWDEYVAAWDAAGGASVLAAYQNYCDTQLK